MPVPAFFQALHTLVRHRLSQHLATQCLNYHDSFTLCPPPQKLLNYGQVTIPRKPPHARALQLVRTSIFLESVQTGQHSRLPQHVPNSHLLPAPTRPSGFITAGTNTTDAQINTPQCQHHTLTFQMASSQGVLIHSDTTILSSTFPLA